MKKIFSALTILSLAFIFGCATTQNTPQSGGGKSAAGASHIITTATTDGGSIDPSGEIAVQAGTNLLLIITPDSGYGVVDILVDGKSIGVRNRYLFQNVAGPHTIEAVFGPAITASAGKGGIVYPNGTSILAQGGSQTYLIEPLQGYSIKEVIVDNDSLPPVTSHTFTNVIAPHTITAMFAKTDDLTITATAEGRGTISPSGEVAVTDSTNALFTMIPDAGYGLFDVVVDRESRGANKDRYLFLNVTENHTIIAIFHPTITASAGPGGFVWPNRTRMVDDVKKMTDMVYTFTPKDGYHVKDVEVNGKSVGARTTYRFGEITEPQTIRGIFTEN